MKRIILCIASAAILALAAVGAGAAEPIKLGAFFDLSGPAAAIGTPTKLVAEMVVDQINKAGGINGRMIKLVFGDTEGNPTKALTVAKRLVEVENVVALIGPTRTGTGMAVKKYVGQKGIPTFMTVGGDPVIMGGKFGPFNYVFKSPQRSSIAVQKIMMHLKKQGTKKIALLTASDGFGKDGLRWLKKYAPEYGLDIVAEETFGVRDTDMTAQLTAIKAKSPEVIVAWTIGPAGAIIAKNVKQLAITATLAQCHGLPDPKYIELATAEAAEGNIMPSTKLMAAAQLPDSDPQKKVILEFISLYNDTYNYDEQFPINTHSGYAWDAIKMVVAAIGKVGTDREKVRGAIEQTKGYVGISGVYNLTAEDHNGLGTDSMIIVQVKDGGWKLLD